MLHMRQLMVNRDEALPLQKSLIIIINGEAWPVKELEASCSVSYEASVTVSKQNPFLAI